MLKHEYQLIEDRLKRENHPNKQYFTFANTVTTINFHKTGQGHGWFGVKFQTKADRTPSEVFLIVHQATPNTASIVKYAK